MKTTISAAPPVGIDDITSWLPDWERHLKAANLADSTVDSYRTCARNLAAYLTAAGLPTAVADITKAHLEAFIVDLLDRLSEATAAKHYRSLQQFFKYLEAEGEIGVSPMARMRPPQVTEQPVPILTDDELGAMLHACKGADFMARRDAAILRILIETGVRLGEIGGIAVDDIDWNQDVITVEGKGRRRRNVPFGNRTGEALRRYLRARAKHPMVLSGRVKGELWVGRMGAMTDSGVYQVLERRGKQAGVAGVHTHRFRHTFANDWLRSGHQETDLMRLAGWKSRQMVGRYAASAADERARDAAHRAARGDRF